MRRQSFGPPRIALSQLEPRLSEGAGELRFLEQCARSGEQHPDFAAPKPLECLYALARNLRVRLDLAKAFTWWIKRDGSGVDERLQIGEPALRAGDTLRDNKEESSLTGVR
jgi:hypothetical protein